MDKKQQEEMEMGWEKVLKGLNELNKEVKKLNKEIAEQTAKFIALYPEFGLVYKPQKNKDSSISK